MPTLTASYSGFVNGDTLASLTTQPMLTTTATAASRVGPTRLQGAAADPDYMISYVVGTLLVKPATPLINVVDAGGTYNGLPNAATATMAGVVSGADSTPVPASKPRPRRWRLITPAASPPSNWPTRALVVVPSAVGVYTVAASFAGMQHDTPVERAADLHDQKHAANPDRAGQQRQSGAHVSARPRRSSGTRRPTPPATCSTCRT